MDSDQFIPIWTVANMEEIKKLTAPFFEKGFSFEYFYQKGGDFFIGNYSFILKY